MSAFSFFGHPVDDETLATLPDYLVLKENKPGGVLVSLRRRTRPAVPRPRGAVEHVHGAWCHPSADGCPDRPGM